MRNKDLLSAVWSWHNKLPNARNSQAWVRPKSGIRNSVCVTHMAGRDLIMCTILGCWMDMLLRVGISRKLESKEKLRLRPGHSVVGCKLPKQSINHCTKCPPLSSVLQTVGQFLLKMFRQSYMTKPLQKQRINPKLCLPNIDWKVLFISSGDYCSQANLATRVSGWWSGKNCLATDQNVWQQ